MISKRFGFFSLLLALNVVLFACAGAQEPAAEQHPHWAYEGEAGPENWGELDEAYEACSAGLAQSPIDLANASAQDLANISFSYQPSEVKILNNGHTIQVNYDEGSSIEVSGVQYSLLQFHFHMPSEHTLDGQQFPGELHLVHRNADGALAVVGLFLQTGAANSALQPVWDHLPAEEVEEQATGAEVNANDFLPSGGATFRYPGSLTTPPCSEGVSWFVMTTPVEISAEQLAEFEAIFTGNNRPVQELGERELIEDSTP